MLSVKDSGDFYTVQAAGTLQPTACPHCGNVGLFGHGSQLQKFVDTPTHGKRLLVEIERKRYRCKACSKTLFESLPDMDAKRSMTDRLRQFIEARSLKHTFAEVSRDVGVDEKTIRHIFDDYVERTAASIKFESPEVLGIDELKIIGQYRCILTNVKELSLYDLLPSRKKATLLAYFKRMPDKQNVKLITMDMWSVYRQVMAEQFPGRLIVADRFHVCRMANDALERARKRIRRSMETKMRLRLKNERFVLLMRNTELNDEQRNQMHAWGKMFPDLAVAYEFKERFFSIYEQSSRQEAERVARSLERDVEKAGATEFREAIGALNSWWQEIFAWYEYPVTNAYTESVNRLAKDINRMGRGYSLEVVKARLLYDQEARKPTSKTIRKHVKKAVPEPPTIGLMMFASAKSKPAKVKTVVEAKTVEYGPHIPTLCRLLEEGHFD